jgi:hypothetical protein
MISPTGSASSPSTGTVISRPGTKRLDHDLVVEAVRQLDRGLERRRPAAPPSGPRSSPACSASRRTGSRRPARRPPAAPAPSASPASARRQSSMSRFAMSLSMATALPSMPLPVYGMPRQVQQRLQRAALAGAAVEREEQHVDVAQLRRLRDRSSLSPRRAGPARRRSGGSGRARRRRAAALLRVVEHARRRIDGDHLVTLCAQRLTTCAPLAIDTSRSSLVPPNSTATFTRSPGQDAAADATTPPSASYEVPPDRAGHWASGSARGRSA